MERPVRSLKLELHSQERTPLPEQLGCALLQKKTCCDGYGFRLKASGSFTQAVLCDCVTKCESCFGLNRLVIDGKSRPCRTPAPSRTASLINSACLPARYSGARLEDFENLTGNGEKVLKLAKDWLGKFDLNNPRGLILSGPVGVGKTYILVSLAKKLLYRGISVRFVDFFQLLQELKAAYIEDKPASQLLREAIQADVLIIDELGKGRSSDYEYSILDQMVMSRYNQNKIIVGSTNYDLKPLEEVNIAHQDLERLNPNKFGLNRHETLEMRIGERVYSRLAETAELIEMTGDDYRKRNFRMSKP